MFSNLTPRTDQSREIKIEIESLERFRHGRPGLYSRSTWPIWFIIYVTYIVTVYRGQRKKLETVMLLLLICIIIIMVILLLLLYYYYYFITKVLLRLCSSVLLKVV